MNPLANALELLQTLNALRPISADQELRIWQKFRLDWNFHSNHLEGNSLTYGETKSLLLHNITAQGKPLKDHLEITGHNEALLEIQEAVKQQRPITESFLRQLHTLILKERYQVDAQTAQGQSTRKWVEVGQYKTQPNHVITATGEMFRFAEPFEVAAKMEALVQEANSKCSTPEEGLLLAAKLHYQFVLIHPFDDGNGRMARILMNLVLMRCGFPPAIIKTQEKEAYFSALRQADGGQFEVFGEYIAARVAESLKIMVAGARGEAIDEPDDLDKQIALLRGKIQETQGGTAQPLTSRIEVRQWLDLVAQPILEQFLNMSEKFASFYGHHSFTLVINGVGYQGNKNTLLKQFKDASPESIEVVSCQANFSKLQMMGIKSNGNDFLSYFTIEAAPLSYQIKSFGFDSIIYKYSQLPAESEVSELVKRLGDVHLQWLEDQRKKTQSLINKN
jgi:Fic family protein